MAARALPALATVSIPAGAPFRTANFPPLTQRKIAIATSTKRAKIFLSMHKLLRRSATFAAIILCSFGAIRAVQAATELARINSTVITLEDFNKKYHENLKFFQFRAPTKEGVLDDLVKRELGIQEAKREGLDKDPEIIDRMNTVLYHALLDKKLSKEFEAIHVTDDEAKSFYAKNPEIRTSHIFVAVRPDAKPAEVEAARARIMKIYNEQLKPGKMSFSEVAQRFSEGVAAPMGGDIDYQTKDKLDPGYYKAAMALSVGQYTHEPVRSQFGWHIIKLTAKRQWDDVDKAQVKRLVFDERRNEIFEHYMAQLRTKYKVAVNKELLKE
jgi:peptidyl-prolyl cis-trans isomerase C/peptidyl-prolyl cis-trans isomerase D